jgi:zinc transporter, ZIP family
MTPDTSTAESNKGIAFAIVIGASFATGIGASVVFVPRLVKLANRCVLASSLGFSAGIMIYVSFVEIFPKSTIRFEGSGYGPDHSFNLGTMSFFGGVLFTMVCTF